MVHTLAEAVNTSDSEAALVFADSVGDTPVRRLPRKLLRTLVSVVIALTFVGMQAWRCADDDAATTYTQSPSGYDTSGNDPDAVAQGERAELRRLLDELMAVNAGLPQTVEESLPDESQQAAALGRELKEWKRDHDASREDELLATAGARFAFALTDWLDDPGAPGTYDAYVRAWDLWDMADETWETAEE